MATLPYVKIDYGNGALGQAIASADSLLCLVVVGAVAVADTFTLAQHYALRKYGDLENMGITADNNPEIEKLVSDFYKEAQEGTKVYLVGYPDTLHMSDVLEKTNPYARNVIEATNGEIRGLIVTKKAGAQPDIENGLSSDVEASKLAAQELGNWATEVRFAPIFTLIDGLNYQGDPEALEDMTKQGYNRVGVVIGASSAGSANQAIGLIAGRIAASSVQRNIGRVQDGALNVLALYAGDKPIELADIETLVNKGYITFRTFTGVSGYYIAGDPLATKPTDDYNAITRRRVIDKAYRIAYAVLIEKLIDEIPVNTNGTMIETYARAFELAVENAIVTNMTANGELSTDPSDSTDRGVTCKIDRTINVLATNRVGAELRVRPHGYAKYINVLLGFTVTQN
ncbi:DUF2586 family protein [Paludibacter sp. 221]|uniref:DUF2586 family protein n=1 Tax=Paludibacter sp. 221 TaxID=2302939 RepID=UPI0013D868EE|nr:DUF2586 family protein [Paludibacter sp. 221]NDV45502.1 DUF2586 family protein [Paludibacter sp. 221]